MSDQAVPGEGHTKPSGKRHTSIPRLAMRLHELSAEPSPQHLQLRVRMTNLECNTGLVGMPTPSSLPATEAVENPSDSCAIKLTSAGWAGMHVSAETFPLGNSCACKSCIDDNQ